MNKNNKNNKKIETFKVSLSIIIKKE